jgi:hypothetical protein
MPVETSEGHVPTTAASADGVPPSGIWQLSQASMPFGSQKHARSRTPPQP